MFQTGDRLLDNNILVWIYVWSSYVPISRYSKHNKLTNKSKNKVDGRDNETHLHVSENLS